MRSKFPCSVCGTKLANSGFVSPGSHEKCLCRPCYARQPVFNLDVDVQTSDSDSDDSDDELECDNLAINTNESNIENMLNNIN
jgi:hypothetical protein